MARPETKTADGKTKQHRLPRTDGGRNKSSWGRTKKEGGKKVAAARARRTARQWPFLSVELPASARELLAHSTNKAASPPPLTSAFVGGRQVRQHSA